MSDIGKIIRVNALPPLEERENNVIYQVAAPGAATYKDYAIDANGDLKTPSYIPLTGTEEGKPLTKNIEVDPSQEGSVGLTSNTPDISMAALVIQEDDSILAESSNSSENSSSSIHIHYDDGVEISATTSDEQFSAIIDTSGLKGDHYIPPTSDRHYVQKKYLADNFTSQPALNGTLANYYTKPETYSKAEVDAKISAVYRSKGSVANFASLPITGNTEGDVWNVLDTGANYVWVLNLNNTGTPGWDELSETVDLTSYYTKTQVNAFLEEYISTNGTVPGKPLAGMIETDGTVPTGFTSFHLNRRTDRQITDENSIVDTVYNEFNSNYSQVDIFDNVVRFQVQNGATGNTSQIEMKPNVIETVGNLFGAEYIPPANGNYYVQKSYVDNISDNYIPITGTSSGKLLTGLIETSSSVETGFTSNNGDLERVIKLTDDGGIIQYASNPNVTSSIDIYPGYIEIASGDNTENSHINVYNNHIETKGDLIGNNYIPPSTDNYYVQKKYVDDKITLENLSSIVNRDNYTPKPIYFVNGDEEFTSLGMNQNTYSYFWGNMNPNHTGDANIAIGYYSMGNMTTGEFNVSVGISSLQNLTTGKSNSSFGSYTLQGLTTGYKNVAFGRGAGAGMSTGNLNTLIGYKANNSVNFGDKNIFLGAHSAQGVTGSNNILIGVGAGINGGALNNKLIIHSNHTLSGYSSSSGQEGIFATPQLSYLENALISGDFVDRLATFNVNSLAIRQTGNANTAITITPNSGAGITSAIQHTPTNHKDFVQKKYIDDKWQEFIIFDTGPTIDIAPEALNIDVTNTVMGSSSSVNITNGLKPMQRFTLMNLGDSDLSFQLNGYTVGASLSPYTKRVYIATNNGTGLVSSQDQELVILF